MCAEDSSDATNLVPICTPSAPRTIAASILLPSMIPPAAIKGICIVFATSGTRQNVVVSSMPLCPPASKPSATTASTPACSAFFANLTLETTCTTFIPCFFNSPVQVFGFPADVKTIGTCKSKIDLI